jgi:drug/metabolite transporter (DMT)-like permease
MTEEHVPPMLQLLLHTTLILTNAMSASMFIFTKISLQFIHPIVFGALRAIVNTFTMLPIAIYFDRHFVYEYRKTTSFVGLRKIIWMRTPHWKHCLLLIACGFNTAITQVLFISALSFMTANLAATFTPINVVVISFISMVVKNEEKSVLKFVGVIISVLGAIATILSPMLLNGGQMPFDQRSLIGVGLLSLNTINNGINSNLQTALMTRWHIPPLTVTAWNNVFNMIFTCSIAPFFWSQCNFADSSWDVYYGIIYAGTIGASIPWSLNNFATKKLKPTVVVIYACMQTIFVAIFSYFVLNETMTWTSAVGAIVIISGVVCVAIAKYREIKLTEENDPEEPVQKITDIELPPKLDGSDTVMFLDVPSTGIQVSSEVEEA